MDRRAGQAYVVTACLTTSVAHLIQALAAGDLSWPVTVLVVAFVAIGAHVVAFALGRLVRTGSVTR